jgi:ABC-2 type transport system ATP-binding protein
MRDGSVIEVEELGKSYKEGLIFRRRLEALRGVSFRVEQGEVFGLLGPNGAGKTTLIKVLLGIVRATGGKAWLMGAAAGRREGRRSVGYLPEHVRMPSYHSANTAMEFYGRLSGLSMKAIRQRRGPLLERVGLADRADERIDGFSKGMLQRLALAQALLHDPTLLILDEPTDGLDPFGRSDVRRVLSELRTEGRTVFLNSHLLQEVELICDRVAILDQGRLRFVGPVNEIVSRTTTSFDLVVEVLGPPERIRGAFEQMEILSWEPRSNELIRVATKVGAQSDVDRLVDRIRQADGSIVSLSPRRATLEDAFIALLRPPAEKS